MFFIVKVIGGWRSHCTHASELSDWAPMSFTAPRMILNMPSINNVCLAEGPKRMTLVFLIEIEKIADAAFYYDILFSR